MKNKIEIGQCYRWDNHTYEVCAVAKDKLSSRIWIQVRDTFTKDFGYVDAIFLMKQERPFTNCG